MTLLDIQSYHLEYVDGKELLNLIETSKSMHKKYHGKLHLWKFIYENEFGKIRCPCCVPRDYRLQYISDWYDFRNSVVVSI
jgi:hypothetical protein|tara:strand:- start:729 stop:971 length:243 start_codon:yes stop_codon:yes gene_type:complete